jgi:hypothetical protein
MDFKQPPFSVSSCLREQALSLPLVRNTNPITARGILIAYLNVSTFQRLQTPSFQGLRIYHDF